MAPKTQPKPTTDEVSDEHDYAEEPTKVSSKKPNKNPITEVKNSKYDKNQRKRKNDSDMSDIEEVRTNQYERDRLDNIMNREKEFWKLRKVSCPNMIYECKRCKNYNYHLGNDCFELDPGKTPKTDRVWYKKSLCRGCVLWNMDMQDLQMKHYDDAYPDYIVKKKRQD